MPDIAKLPSSTGVVSNQWTNPTNAYTNNGVFTTDTTSGHKQSYGTFGFGLPSNITINGIIVTVRAKTSGGFGSAHVGVDLSYNNGTNWVTVKNTTNLTSTNIDYTVGGATDTWGRTWAQSDFADGTFLARISNSPAWFGGTTSVDSITVDVYYTVNNTTTNQTQSGVSRVTATTVQNQSGKGNILAIHQYSRAPATSLPTNSNDLATLYSNAEVTDVQAVDGVFVDLPSTLNYMLHEFKDINVNNTDQITLTWTGKSTKDCSVFPTKLQIYNNLTAVWEDVATNTTTVAGTSFTLTGVISASLSNYYNSNFQITARVYQEVI